MNGIRYINNNISVLLCEKDTEIPAFTNWLNKQYTEEEFEKESSIKEYNLAVKLGEKSVVNNRFLYSVEIRINDKTDTIINTVTKLIKDIFCNNTKLPVLKNFEGDLITYFFLSKIPLESKSIYEDIDKRFSIKLKSTGDFSLVVPSLNNGMEVKFENSDIFSLLFDSNKIADLIIDDLSLIKLDFKEVLVKIYNDKTIEENLKKLQEDYLKDNKKLIAQELFNHFEHKNEFGISLLNKTYPNEIDENLKLWGTLFSNGVANFQNIFSNCKEETSVDRIRKFNVFLNDEKNVISFETLKEHFKENKLKEYEIESFIGTVGEKLSNNTGVKHSTVATRKVLKSIEDEMKAEKENENKLEIGLDDSLSTLILNEFFNNGKNIVYNAGILFIYKSGKWSIIEEGVLSNIVLKSIRKIMNSDNIEYLNIKENIIKSGRNNNLNSLTNQITELLLKIIYVGSNEDLFNVRNTVRKKYSVINTLNKELYIADGELIVQDHSADSYLLSQFNVNYDPDADCPTWDKALDSLFLGDQEAIDDFVEKLALGIQSKKTDPFWILGVGKGKNGKSEFFKNFFEMLGTNSFVSISMASFLGNTHAESALVGKHFLYDDDYKKGTLLPDDSLKKLCENKPLTANPKFKDPFMFISNTTPVVIANNYMKTSDTSEGFMRRVCAYEFKKQFTSAEIDRKIGDKLYNERSGFLNKLIKSYLAYEARKGVRLFSKHSQEAKFNFMRNSNSVLAFVLQNYVITKDKSHVISSQDVFKKYNDFIDQERLNNSLARSGFYEALCQIDGITQHKNSRTNSYEFCGLIPINPFKPHFEVLSQSEAIKKLESVGLGNSIPSFDDLPDDDDCPF